MPAPGTCSSVLLSSIVHDQRTTSKLYFACKAFLVSLVRFFLSLAVCYVRLPFDELTSSFIRDFPLG
uniref:Uncharacterized protein n=1 Tax=Parascaris univalens TaxID=6257 RepID=A0A915A224_PARUN